MARSPLTLAAAVTAAVPGADVIGTRPLTNGAEGRFDSAVVTLADGSEAAIRVAENEEASRELSAEAVALNALTPGARAMLPFEAPVFLGHTRIEGSTALVTTLLTGFQIDSAHIPGGRGAATAIGDALAAIHALPASVVRSAGLGERPAAQVREDLRSLIDQAAATGRVSARLTVRWREAADADELWRFESTVIAGGVHAHSFLFRDDADRGPVTAGVIGWHGLSIGDPAADLSWLTGVPEAADDILAAYAAAATRAPDLGLAIRARLWAELEFARWLVHGEQSHRPEVVDDAAELLDALAENVRDDDLLAPLGDAPRGVDDALDAIRRVPPTAASSIDTSMHTDAYDPERLREFTGAPRNPDLEDTGRFEPLSSPGAEAPDAAQSARPLPRDEDATETGVIEDEGFLSPSDLREDGDKQDPAAEVKSTGDAELDAEAQRAARAAFQRWTSSSSE